jgi:prepilin-type N-terminal cleavage/methylation domain-containing protein
MKVRLVTGRRKRKGFSLIELLVVIAVIAILMAILMPSLSRARKGAWAVKCGANARNVGLAMVTYVTDYDSYYPASYLYCAQRGGSSWNIRRQDYSHQGKGYLHWSYFLFSSGLCDASAFECPAIPRQGIPRTNPGANPDDWETNQVDMDGRSGSNPNLVDFQAPRMGCYEAVRRRL